MAVTQKVTIMPLRITLKPYECIMLGRTVLNNGPQPASFIIRGEKIPILRSGEIMDEANADTPCKRLYRAVQEIYLSQQFDAHAENHVIQAAQDIIDAAPSLKLHVADVSSLFLLGQHYDALKRCRVLIRAEADIMTAIVPGITPRHRQLGSVH
jgi:flagellar biosynthesis repressor protein FlbT